MEDLITTKIKWLDQIDVWKKVVIRRIMERVSWLNDDAFTINVFSKFSFAILLNCLDEFDKKPNWGVLQIN